MVEIYFSATILCLLCQMQPLRKLLSLTDITTLSSDGENSQHSKNDMIINTVTCYKNTNCHLGDQYVVWHLKTSWIVRNTGMETLRMENNVCVQQRPDNHCPGCLAAIQLNIWLTCIKCVMWCSICQTSALTHLWYECRPSAHHYGHLISVPKGLKTNRKLNVYKDLVHTAQ